MLRTFWKCDVYVEMLNGFLPRIAENEVLGFNVVQSIARLTRMSSLSFEQKSTNESNAS